MTAAQATRIRGGIDLALVLSLLSRATQPQLAPEDDDDEDEDSEAIRAAAAELGKLTVGEAADRVLALMEAEGRRMLAQDPRQLALFDNKR